MANSTKLWILVVAAIVVGIFYVQQSKTSRMATTAEIWSGEKDDVQKVIVTKAGESIELLKQGGRWIITGHDSLSMRENRIDGLFNKVLAVKRTTLMTEKESRWEAYSVTDSLGIVLAIQDVVGNDLANFVFGQSRSDWSKNYVRIGSDPTVYLTDANITYHLNTTSDFWGEIPKPPEVDSTAPPSGQVIEVDAGMGYATPVVELQSPADTSSSPLQMDIIPDTTTTK
jgi:hypothetical protein